MKRTVHVCYVCKERYAFVGMTYCCGPCVLHEERKHSKRCNNHVPRVKSKDQPYPDKPISQEIS